jgi:hypothetical protein
MLRFLPACISLPGKTMFNQYWPSLSVVLVCLAVMPAWAQDNDSGADQLELREIRKQLQTLNSQLQLRLDGINKRLDHMERLLGGRAGTVKPAKARNAIRAKKRHQISRIFAHLTTGVQSGL